MWFKLWLLLSFPQPLFVISQQAIGNHKAITDMLKCFGVQSPPFTIQTFVKPAPLFFKASRRVHVSTSLLKSVQL